MIKYIIVKYTPDGYGGNLSEIKTIRKKELKEYLKNGWFLQRKIVPLITPFVGWWNKFSTNQKIAIIAFIIPSFFGGLGWCLDKYFDNNYNDLIQDYKNLDSEYNQLNQTYILTSDSLKVERERTENLRQQLTSEKASDKNQVDKKN